MVALLCAPFFVAGASDGDGSFKVLVIDPGHGGKDPGTVSYDGKTYEKHVVLDIARRFAAKVNMAFPDVKVVMTRDSDEYVKLGARVSIAQENSADLFVSIHVNATAKGTAARGCSAYLLSQKSSRGTDLFEYNAEVTARENSVLEYESDSLGNASYLGYDPDDPVSVISHRLLASANFDQGVAFSSAFIDAISKTDFPKYGSKGICQGNIQVLRDMSKPAVLLECGFMTNRQDLSLLRTEQGKEALAEALFQAFEKYLSEYNNTSLRQQNPPSSASPVPVAPTQAAPSAPATSAPNPPASTSPAAAASVPSDTSVRYAIQVLCLSAPLPSNSPYRKQFQLKEYKAGKFYKYVVYETVELSQTVEKLSTVRKIFPDCFVVRIEGDKLVFHMR